MSGRRHSIRLAGRFIKTERERLGIARCELAKKIGCTQGMICQVENDKVPFPFIRWKIYEEALQIEGHRLLQLAFAERLPNAVP